ncbi:hypothetical protein BX666DRAFT_1600426 [Dichotomocladium elegans]|nr:hypothetical protein BX666DRAFT_1600426 [Dichotomocladium elegans]
MMLKSMILLIIHRVIALENDGVEAFSTVKKGSYRERARSRLQTVACKVLLEELKHESNLGTVLALCLRSFEKPIDTFETKSQNAYTGPNPSKNLLKCILGGVTSLAP